MGILDFEKYFSDLLVHYFKDIELRAPDFRFKKRNWMPKEPFKWSTRDEESIYTDMLLSKFQEYKQKMNHLQKLIEESFPEFNQKMVFINRGSSMAVIAESFFPLALNEVFDRKTQDMEVEKVVRDVVGEMIYFLRNEEVKFIFYVPLAGFNEHEGFELEPIKLKENLVLRRLTDQEISDCIENGITVNAMGAFFPDAHAYGIVAEIGFKRVLLENHPGQDLLKNEDELSEIRNVMLALRVFKSGAVTCNHFYQKSAKFVPVSCKAIPPGDFYSPYYSYELKQDEAKEFADFYQKFTAKMDRNLSLACQKLNGINKETDFTDRLLDSAIGLEAILLSGSGENENRGELRYRFSMNYASLFPKELRLEKFNQAKRIYQSRNRLVHASHISKEEMNEMKRDAVEASEMLRHAVKKFIGKGERPDYLESQYWERSVLES